MNVFPVTAAKIRTTLSDNVVSLSSVDSFQPQLKNSSVPVVFMLLAF